MENEIKACFKHHHHLPCPKCDWEARADYLIAKTEKMLRETPRPTQEPKKESK